MEKLTRREALKNLLGGAALAMVPPLVLPQEPVRRIWQVGKKLRRPTREETQAYDPTVGHTYNPGVSYEEHLGRVASGDMHGGLRPIEGQPGFFKDMETGQIIKIGDFRETTKWDSISIFGEESPDDIGARLDELEGKTINIQVQDRAAARLLEEDARKKNGVWRLDERGTFDAQVFVGSYVHGIVKASG